MNAALAQLQEKQAALAEAQEKLREVSLSPSLPQRPSPISGELHGHLCLTVPCTPHPVPSGTGCPGSESRVPGSGLQRPCPRGAPPDTDPWPGKLLWPGEVDLEIE